MKGVGTKVAKGAIWMVLFKLIERSLGLISTMILARLLFPEDFGLIAMAMSLIAAIELISAFGFDMALIQNHKATRKHYDTAWTFNVILYSSAALLLLFLAHPGAAFYKEPRLVEVIQWLSLGVFASGFANIGVVAFRKELEFSKEFKFLLGKKIASFSITIPLAFILNSYWALVIGIVAGKFAELFLSYYVHEYRPRFDLTARKELFSFSAWLFVNNVLSFVQLRSADFLIGRIIGPHSLGIYSVAFEISSMPTTELIAPINRAVYPGYTKVSNSPSALRNAFLNVISLIAIFAIPAGIGIVVTADLLVGVILGERWLEAIPLIKILAIYGVLTALQTNTIYIYFAIGKPHVSTYLSIVYIALLLPLLFYLVSSSGLNGAVWSYLIATAILTPLNLGVIFFQLRISPFSFIRKIWRTAFASLAMYFGVNYYIDAIAKDLGIDGNIELLFTAVFVGAVIFTLSVLILWLAVNKPDGAETQILRKVYPRLPHFLKVKTLKPNNE